MLPASQKYYASLKNPTIEAVIGGLFSFETHAQAEARLAGIRQLCVVSKDSDEETLVLWVKDFVDEDERADGYAGNFAGIRVALLPNGRFTLAAEKIVKHKKFHPRRVREKHSHPNWGHPILRRIKKETAYASAADAQAALDALHEEYPAISIPGKGRLLLMVYGPVAKGDPVSKYVLEIKPGEDDTWRIAYAINKKTQLDGMLKKERETSAAAGFFTALVKKKKK